MHVSTLLCMFLLCCACFYSVVHVSTSVVHVSISVVHVSISVVHVSTSVVPFTDIGLTLILTTKICDS